MTSGDSARRFQGFSLRAARARDTISTMCVCTPSFALHFLTSIATCTSAVRAYRGRTFAAPVVTCMNPTRLTRGANHSSGLLLIDLV